MSDTSTVIGKVQSSNPEADTSNNEATAKTLILAPGEDPPVFFIALNDVISWTFTNPENTPVGVIGSGAVIGLFVVAGVVNGASIIAAGSQYYYGASFNTEVPAIGRALGSIGVSILNGAPPGYLAGEITNCDVTDGGAFYRDDDIPVVAISKCAFDTDGADGEITAIVSGGVVTAFVVANRGHDYNSNIGCPTALAAYPNIFAASLSATANLITGALESVVVENGGQGFDDDLVLIEFPSVDLHGQPRTGQQYPYGPYTGKITASPDDDYVYTVVAGALPAGLTINENTGKISGTPTALSAGEETVFTVRATNQFGAWAEREYRFLLNEFGDT